MLVALHPQFILIKRLWYSGLMENSVSPLNNLQPQPKKTSHRASIVGITLALFSVALSGIGNLLIVAEPNTQPSPTASEVENQVGQAVADGTLNTLGTLFAVPLLVGAFVVGFVAVVFILLRLRKVRVIGAIFSIIALLLVVWSYSIAINAFDLIKATPA